MGNNDLPFTVTDNYDGTFTFDWDSEHPTTSVMNDWDDEDFLNLIKLGLKEWEREKEDRDWRTEFTVDEFVDNWNELYARVEAGEHLTIIRPDGKAAVMMPAGDLNV